MYTRHDEVPVYQQRDDVIPAAYFNTVQTAFRRLGTEIRLQIPGLQSLDLILQVDAWIVVDRSLNDVPIAAWSGFVRKQTDALHLPLHCCLRLYHASAGIIIERVLEAMELLLGMRLRALEESHRVLDFPRRGH